jgi:hypothetical protein
VQSLLQRRGLAGEAEDQDADPLSMNEPGMASLLTNSVRRKVAVGSNIGRSVVRLGDRIGGDELDPFESPRCAMVAGFSIHACERLRTQAR